MSAEIISGKEIAASIRAELKERVAGLEESGLTPGLAVVLVGDDPASHVYVGMKNKAATEAGIHSRQITLPAEVAEEELLGIVAGLNADPDIHGILVQLPLPDQMDEAKVLLAVDPEKDVDGFHPLNVGRLATGDLDVLTPCTPGAVIEMLMRSGHDPAGKRAVVVGRSNIVGRPMASLLLRKASGGNATVTVAHSRTADLGVNRVDDDTRESGYRLTGDVAFDEVKEVAAAISPVPGGVGPMAIAMLLSNTVDAAVRSTNAGG